MTKKEADIVLGGLLHDIGKVIYRQGDDRRKHSRSGYDFLKDEVGLKDEDAGFLDCVRYHHADAIKNADLKEDSIAYITYMADNIAASADRREKEDGDWGFEASAPLQSVFGILNGNNEECYYQPGMLDPKNGINFPGTEIKPFDEVFYNEVKTNLQDNIRGLEWNAYYIDSLLETLEANLSFVPSSTSKAERTDISLYDHMKLTAALSSCIYRYLEQSGDMSYRTRLFVKAKEFYTEKAFLLYSLDISGIQKFIYTITSKNALKTLRARSFYLEILMEHLIDELIKSAGVSRANLLYSGGGHCYLLFPNTADTIEKTEAYIGEVNTWLMEHFDIALYVAAGYAECSAEELQNKNEGAYKDIFRRAGNMISERKTCRYDAAAIRYLNRGSDGDHRRECKVCRRIGETDERGICTMCASIEDFSKNILYDDFFIISKREEGASLTLPGGFYLRAESEDAIRSVLETYAEEEIRVYGKNRQYTGKHIASKIWVADHTTGQSFEELADAASGIDRIAVLRADADNLGQTFVAGFESEKNGEHYVTISRTATLSRQLSLFFKLHINRILERPVYSGLQKNTGNRKVAVCYSGGDDIFLVGAWDDVIGAAVDIRQQFERYTRGTVTISAGIGLYPEGYPVSAAAAETAELEEQSKKREGKAGVTIMPDGHCHKEGEKVISDGTYGWKEFEEKVIREKYAVIADFFENSEDRGNSFLYRILELIRNRKDRINFARCVYMLSRLEPGKDAPADAKENYRRFSGSIYEWIQRDEDCRQLKTAINIYVYMNRQKEEGTA